MLQEFVNQNYLIIQNNVVSNIVLWNGDTTLWSPPQNSIALVQSTISALLWQEVIVDKKIVDYILVDVIGAGSIGFTWDGSILTTNQPKPEIPIQPITTGTMPA